MTAARLDAVTRQRLHAVTARLASEYEGVFAAGTVLRLVEDSAARLGDVTVTRFVPLLVERFARERLMAAAHAALLVAKPRPQVLFICTQNAGRSQMAAALTRRVSEGAVDALSAGSDPAEAIDDTVVEVLAEVGIEVALEFPKPLTVEVLSAADVVVTMGCDDACLILPGPHYLDWHVRDPAARTCGGAPHPPGHRRPRPRPAQGAPAVTPTAGAVAVITDIHANLPALQATLARVDELGIERMYCGGDLVGYGPHPNEVCALIAERGIPTIYGNYDYAIARDEHDCGCAYVTPHDRELGQRSVEWTLVHADAASKDFMRGLPFDLRFAVGERDVHLVHGSPRKVNEYLFEDKPERLYEKFAAGEEADALVFGHTHKPWIRTFRAVLFVNCGSVGKPKDGDPRGAFAVLDLDESGRVRARIERVGYDAAAVAEQVAAAGLPAEYAEKLVAAA